MSTATWRLSDSSTRFCEIHIGLGSLSCKLIRSQSDDTANIQSCERVLPGLLENNIGALITRIGL